MTEAKEAACSSGTPLQDCCLLRLPAEIRNLIYDFAYEHDTVIFVPRHTEKFSKMSRKISPRSVNTTNKFAKTFDEPETEDRSKSAIRQFRSLTQVCRLFRSEYLPLYRSMITYRISHMHLQDYLDTVLLSECLRNAQTIVPLPVGDQINTSTYWEAVDNEALTQREHITRTLLIDCKARGERVGKANSTPTKADLLPFLKFCVTAPGIRVQCGTNTCECCTENWSGLRNILNILFGVSRRPKIASWLNDSVDGVELFFPPLLNIRMKKGHGKKWMGEYTDHTLTNFGDMDRWTEELGLPIEWDMCRSFHFECYQCDWDLDWGIKEETENAEDAAFWGKDIQTRRGKPRHEKSKEKVQAKALNRRNKRRG